MSSQFPFALSDQCVRCGLCLPHCPTYQTQRREGEGPRGRIVLMEAIAASRLEYSPGAQEQLNHCLGCGRCETVCPAGVPYLAIRDAFRAENLRWYQRLRLWLLADPKGLIWRRLGLALLRWAPARLSRSKHWLSLATNIAKHPAARAQWAKEPAQTAQSSATLHLFQGCVAPELDSRAQQAAWRVLCSLPGHKVALSPRACCGAMAKHAGHTTLAKKHAEEIGRHTAPLVTLDSGCLAALRDAADNVFEACQLVLQEWPDHWQPKLESTRVYLHTPCTHYSAGNTRAIHDLLSRIQGITLIPVRGHGCCGAGGTHLLDDPEHAAQFAQAIVNECNAGPGFLVSTNIGCRVHLRLHMNLRHDIEVRHPLEILEDALQTPSS